MSRWWKDEDIGNSAPLFPTKPHFTFINKWRSDAPIILDQLKHAKGLKGKLDQAKCMINCALTDLSKLPRVKVNWNYPSIQLQNISKNVGPAIEMFFEDDYSEVDWSAIVVYLTRVVRLLLAFGCHWTRICGILMWDEDPDVDFPLCGDVKIGDPLISLVPGFGSVLHDHRDCRASAPLNPSAAAFVPPTCSFSLPSIPDLSPPVSFALGPSLRGSQRVEPVDFFGCQRGFAPVVVPEVSPLDFVVFRYIKGPSLVHSPASEPCDFTVAVAHFNTAPLLPLCLQKSPATTSVSKSRSSRSPRSRPSCRSSRNRAFSRSPISRPSRSPSSSGTSRIGRVGTAADKQIFAAPFSSPASHRVSSSGRCLSIWSSLDRPVVAAPILCFRPNTRCVASLPPKTVPSLARFSPSPFGCSARPFLSADPQYQSWLMWAHVGFALAHFGRAPVTPYLPMHFSGSVFPSCPW